MNPQALNSYSYALNNPIVNKDPDGEILPLLMGAWVVAETGLSIYDGYTTVKTFADPNASPGEKALTGALFIGGVFGPGGGYTQLPKIADKIMDVRKTLKAIPLSPNKLTPTEVPDIQKIKQLERSMESKGFYSDHPVRYYEHEGQKYIVDGHHRTQAAKNLGLDVMAKPVDDSYFQQRWGSNAQEFIKKAKDFTQE